MDGLDKFEQLTATADYVLVLLANEATQDWELVDPEPVAPDKAQTFSERGLVFGGVAAIVHGKPKTTLDADLDDETVSAIAREFVRRVEYALKHPRWCMQPDTHVN